MRRILYIGSDASPGMVPFATSIIRAAIKSKKIEVYAIVVDKDKPLYQTNLRDLPEGKIHFLQTPKNKLKKYINKFYAIDILREVKQICSVRKIDVIHLLTSDDVCATIFRQLKKNAPVYYTVHDVVPHETVYTGIRNYLICKYLGLCEKKITRKADGLVTNSQNQFIRIKSMYPQKKIYFQLFPSLIMSSILSGERTCQEIIHIERYILFFGRIEKYKGVEYLCEAFQNNKNLQDYHLVIAGKGQLYFPHTDDPRVIFINRFIDDSEVKSLFIKASCVVYPYISATQSGVLSLAYKLQTPVLVSDVPYFREVSNEKSCLFFKPTDSKDLSKKLEQLLFHTQLNEMKDAQKDFYENFYSEHAFITSTERLYDDIAITN